MKHKVCDLEGPLLDRAVSKAEGWADDGNHYHYSREWEFAGPIIERERIEIAPNGDGRKWWRAHHESAGEFDEQIGPTPLIAAMRAYVASKFVGREIELP